MKQVFNKEESLKALSELIRIDSLDDNYQKGKLLQGWLDRYSNDGEYNFTLSLNQKKMLSELLYRNTIFLYKGMVEAKKYMDNKDKISKFLD